MWSSYSVEWHFSHVFFFKSNSKLKMLYTSNSKVSSATILDRIVAFHHGILPITSHGTLITWSCKITLWTKINIYTLISVPLAAKFGRMVAYFEGFLATKSRDRCGLAKSREKLKSLYLHYQSVYSQQTWNDSNLPQRAPSQEATWAFNYVVLGNCVTK